NTLWDVRVGRFVYTQTNDPSTGDETIPSRLDLPANITTGAPPTFGSVQIIRTTGKATLSHYRAGLFGADHQTKIGVQVEKGEHHSPTVGPTGTRYVYNNGAPSQAISNDPSNTGGSFITSAAFASDTATVGDRVTISAGLRFDHARAISQDLHGVDLHGDET